jgi:hypothetical protein
MVEVHPRLWIGNVTDCRHWTTRQSDKPAMIHGCKDPCHSLAVGTRSPNKLNPEYLSCLRGERNEHLVLNLIDPPVPLFQLLSFQTALDFLDRWMYHQCDPDGKGPGYPTGPGVIVHCNQGLSRAPSLALLWLAKRAKVIESSDFARAATEFAFNYPAYQPGKGIETFLRANWDLL